MSKTYIPSVILLIFLTLGCATQPKQEKNLKQITPQLVCTFEKTLHENSALWFENENTLWTLNDGGGENILYKVNSQTGKIIHKLLINNATNYDWEALATDKDYLYIADTGNNIGDRKQLIIYKIPKTALSSETTQAEIITYTYEDQTNYTADKYNHDFDCEAIFIDNNQINILTKGWKTGTTTRYQIPTQAGNYIAKKIETTHVNGLITDATLVKNTLYTIQYSRDGEVILRAFKKNKEGLYFNKNNSFSLPNTKNIGQIEGISFSNNKLYISGEDYNEINPNCYQILVK